jgi:hypothetical protein
MPFSPLSGKAGAVLVGSVPYAFGKWQYDMKTDTPAVNNFTSAYRQLVSGLTQGTITTEGPYDNGNMPLTSGNTYTLTCQQTSGVNLTGTAILANIVSSQDIEDAARIKCVWEVTGAFTAAVT